MNGPGSPLLYTTVLDLLPDWVPVQACWVYDPADPWAILLRIRCNRQRWVDWWLARDLLDEGLTGPAGVGDVRLEPYPTDGLLITLSSPDGFALLRADGNHARRFLCASFDLVAPGDECEHPDVEWLLACVDLDVWASGGGCGGGGAW